MNVRHLSREQFANLSQAERDIETLAERLCENDILARQSSLVSDLLSEDREGFTVDDIENLYPDPSDWTARHCREWIDDNLDGSIDYPDEESEGEEQGYLSRDVNDWRDVVRDNTEPSEPLEWWLVTASLADDLDSIGEPLIRNGYGNWWGRTCSGQSIMLDGTLQQIAKNIIERTQ